ncbi:venom carboxylesterase-6-like [Frankliniella occidentalis]|uniref:Carboxylic ester hydrolase n=1 Tax=Frankliniella occidentalis TaxID=133901 RepID=A0A6J1S3S4_FRAOC|nr:venom carboxylesterase-6-like [Frankliniella occidentalis]
MTSAIQAALLGAVLVAAVSAAVEPSDPLVQLEKGAVRGTTTQSDSGRTVFAFKGVPYARPPVGKYRFKDPKPTKPWQGVWDATQFPPKCMQFDRYPVSAVVGEEDCLYLNVFTPRLPAAGAPLLDVLVWIHGGGFMFGGSSDWGPEFLLDKDVVLVTINYRVGPLGFLSTQDEVVPGNMGLKDQSAALRWIQGNIAAFGGNPNSVTLFGLSAGGASVHYHYLSPLSAGAFHRGWSLSGAALCPWTQQEEAAAKAVRLAGLLGCPTDGVTSRDLVACLRHRPARAIAAAVPAFQDEAEIPFSPFAPVAEPAGTMGAFVDRPPIDVLRQGLANDVPWIVGITTEEGLFNAAEFLGAGQSHKLQRLDQDWLRLAPLLLDYNDTAGTEAQRDAVSRAIREHYIGQRPLSAATNEFVAMVGDRIFNAGVEQAAREQSQANSQPVYVYLYGYRGENSLSGAISKPKDTSDWGVSHGDDAAYLFRWECLPTGGNPQELEVRKQLISILTTFARTGVPSGLPGSPGWAPLDPASQDLYILRMDKNAELIFDKVPELGQTAFWNSLPISENAPDLVSARDEL